MTQEDKAKARQADRFLSRYMAADREVRTCKRQLVRMRAMRTSLPSPALDASPIISGHVSDAVASAAVAIAEAEGDLHRRIDAALLIRREVQAVIRAVPREWDRHLLELRYLEGMGYERIAEELGYSTGGNAWRAARQVLAGITIA